MDKNELISVLSKHGDNQKNLAELLGLSLSRTNAKINSCKGAEFTQTEIGMMKDYYDLSPEDVNRIFFAQ